VTPLRALIVAVSPEGVIGLHGQVPWRHPGDMRRFKRVTLGSSVIMGRLTWESMNRRPLPGRRNVVVTRGQLEGVECHPSIEAALAACAAEPVWFIGGARIYQDGMPHCHLLDVTYVPDHVDHPDAVRFPPIDPEIWEPGPLLPHEDEPALTRREFRRR
jgi:dihydrofolate reductase